MLLILNYKSLKAHAYQSNARCVCVCVWDLVMFAYLSGKRARSASLGKYLNSFQRFLLPSSPRGAAVWRTAPQPSPESFTAKDNSEKCSWVGRGGLQHRRGREQGGGPRVRAADAVRDEVLLGLILPSALRRTDDVTRDGLNSDYRDAHGFIWFYSLIYWTTRGDTVPFTSLVFFSPGFRWGGSAQRDVAPSLTGCSSAMMGRGECADPPRPPLLGVITKRLINLEIK